MADSQFLLKNETHQIIGSAMEVLNEIGHRFNEGLFRVSLHLCPSAFICGSP